jgi:hypothetical protein
MSRIDAVVSSILLTFLFSCAAQAKDRNLSCDDWTSKIDLTVREVDFEPLSLPEHQKLAGIACLLALETNHHEARFSGTTRLEVSQMFPPATTDVAALFYISYLFTGNWNHGDAIALWGHEGRINNADDISLAYQKYRDWFKRVSKIGWKKAQKEGIQPLANCPVSWYGK